MWPVAWPKSFILVSTIELCDSIKIIICIIGFIKLNESQHPKILPSRNYFHGDITSNNYFRTETKEQTFAIKLRLETSLSEDKFFYLCENQCRQFYMSSGYSFGVIRQRSRSSIPENVPYFRKDIKENLRKFINVLRINAKHIDHKVKKLP